MRCRISRGGCNEVLVGVIMGEASTGGAGISLSVCAHCLGIL